VVRLKVKHIDSAQKIIRVQRCREKSLIIKSLRTVLSNGSALARPWGMRRVPLASVVLKLTRGAMRTKYFLNLG